MQPIMSSPNVERIGMALRTAFLANKTRPLEWRYTQLKAIKKMIAENQSDICQALKKDLGKCESESSLSEINLVLSECDLAISNLEKWTKTKKVYTPVRLQPSSSQIIKEPLGVVLIMSPWNYPVNLAVIPLIGAVAAGNCAFIKLSPHSLNVSTLLHGLVEKYLDRECIAIDFGDVAVAQALLQMQWDHIFFTGGVEIGRIVYQAAAKHLTPVTLELGGKNPCIIDKECNLKLAAKKIVWSKSYNSGQSCVAPDYLFIHKSQLDEFLELVKHFIHEFFGDDVQKSPFYSRLINKFHAERVSKLMAHGKVVIGGQVDIEDRFVSPTFMVDPDLNSPLMQEEVFGPLLPILTYENMSEVVQFVRSKPHALTLMLYSSSKTTQDYVFNNTQSGAALANEALLHFTSPYLPFGGVGHSGIGAYHGKLTFDLFTHKKACVRSSSMQILDLPVKYPPYTAFSDSVMTTALRTKW
ncbi:hypothetical protein SAMD00019534_084730 [Acytostelium subglobosum LB1]|uniref:hypothetical protein n=1 Tax=Acytostelium subglobosum LB1 TaxID=1410327 RepID=UPI000644B4FB|nr:hypothetical protein SAMD00019534_084730 [Acytostelium subglobosum LB1]GAM25298.1 hypothetical protein SAMD00019534_084730 [Acytostelium subglobosum LB1]|eukprot:XP_012751818.1 hypothetical protein SAMD00019534_084730 [Acytostelium subglobosum LB1]